MSDTIQPKSFWKKPEGKFGGAITIGAVIFGGYMLFKMLPSIIILLENTIYAVILGIIVFVLIYVIMDKRVRALAWYAYRGFFRTLTGVFITIDPIKILENYIVSLKESMEKANEHISAVSQQMSKLKGQVDENASDIEKQLRMASAAEKQNKKPQATVFERQAQRLTESNEKLSTLYTKLNGVYKVLTKIYENAEVLLQDTENEVDLRKREYLSIKSAHSALKSAMNIIHGDQDKKEIFDQTMEYVIDDVRAKVGEMDRYMELSAKAISTIDIENAAFEEEGFELLKKWEADNGIVKKNTKAAMSKKSSSVYSSTGKF